MEELYKVCLAGTNVIASGTENFTTMDQVKEWLLENQVYYSDDDPQKPANDGSKYVILPKDM